MKRDRRRHIKTSNSAVTPRMSGVVIALQAGACLIVMEIESVSVDILDGELPQPPRLGFQGLNDVRTRRFQLVVCGIDIFGEYPMNGGLKWPSSLPKKYRHVRSRHGPNVFVRIEPANLKAECVPIVLLGAFNIGDGQFGNWLGNGR